MVIRILIVDDHEAWRRHIRGALQQTLHYLVIGEAADGLDAVRKAERLKPDLIVLDIGLPTLNGIEVARRIRAVAPDSKILFLSEHREPAIVQAALATGANGYVVKSDSASEFLPAIDAIVCGQPVTPARLAAQRSERSRHRGVPRATRNHAVEFCPNESSVLESFARFTAGALTGGSTAIVVTTGSHREELDQRLRRCGLDIDLAIDERRFVWLDVADLLAEIMVDGWPDDRRFRGAATTLLAQAAARSTCTPPRVAACGEGAPTLWRDGNPAAAVRLEELWDEFAREHDVDLLCGYSLISPSSDEDDLIFQRICAVHSVVHSHQRDARTGEA